MFRIDYVDTLQKPRVQYFKVRSQAEKRVQVLVNAGLMVVHTNWIYIEPKDRDADRQKLEMFETIADEAC